MEELNEEKILFKAVCENNVIYLKTIIDIVSQIMTVEKTSYKSNKSLKQLCLKVNEHGLTFFPSEQNIFMSNIELKNTFFSSYEYNCSPLCIGVALDILKMCFKYVSRNDKLQITITKDELSLYPSTMTFCFNDSKGFVIRLNIVQNVLNSFSVDGFSLLTKIHSCKLPNLHREIGGVKKQVKVTIADDKIKFSSTMVDIAETWATFPLLPETNGLFSTPVSLELRSDFLKILSKLSVFDANTFFYYKQGEMMTVMCEIEKINNQYTGNILIGLNV